MASWQTLMTMVATSMNVGLGLVTQRTGSELEMTAPSHEQTYYSPGQLFDLEPGLLCEHVITHQVELLVADSRVDAAWAGNPDERIGLVSYLGIPVYWPNGEVFGTVCVLDAEPRDFTAADRRLLLSARDAIHDSLGVAADLSMATPADDSEPTGVWDYDPDVDHLRLSPSIVRQYDLGDLVGTGILALATWIASLPPTLRELMSDQLTAILEGAARTMRLVDVTSGVGGDQVVLITGRGIQVDGQIALVVGTHAVTVPAGGEIDVGGRFFARDPVTGLATRAELEFRLRQTLERQRRTSTEAQVVLAIVELKQVGRIVHSDGIEVADALVAELGERLRGANRFVATLGFGYFAVLVHDKGRDLTQRLDASLREDVAVLPPYSGGTPIVAISTVDLLEVAAPEGDTLLRALTRAQSAQLTERQQAIARLVVQGMSNREIAEALVIAVRTVEGHLDGIRAKLGVTSRTQLVASIVAQPELISGAVVEILPKTLQ